MTTGTVIAITASGLAVVAVGYGLYRLGKNIQTRDIKNIDGDGGKLKVDFIRRELLTFEEIAKWIGSLDIPDADSDNLICHLVRYGDEISSYNVYNTPQSQTSERRLFVKEEQAMRA